MRRSTTILFLAAICLAAPCVEVLAQRGPSIKQRFEELDGAGKHDEIVALWKENPFRVLSTIDSYLEGALKIHEEADGKPDAEKVRAMHERALRGARAADVAFGRSIFTDYTSSFIGWNDEEKKRFRAGQKAFGASRKAEKAKDWAKVLEEGRRCLELAQPLGDWWGTAMGLNQIAKAHENLGQHDDSLRAHGTARLIHHNLGLAGSEYGNLVAMSRILEQLERYSRAESAIENALILGVELGRDPIPMLEAKVRVLEKTGRDTEARAVRAAIGKQKAGAKKK